MEVERALNTGGALGAGEGEGGLGRHCFCSSCGSVCSQLCAAISKDPRFGAVPVWSSLPCVSPGGMTVRFYICPTVSPDQACLRPSLSWHRPPSVPARGGHWQVHGDCKAPSRPGTRDPRTGPGGCLGAVPSRLHHPPLSPFPSPPSTGKPTLARNT